MGAALLCQRNVREGRERPKGKDFPQGKGAPERAGAAQVCLIRWERPGGSSSCSDTHPVSIQSFSG